MADKDAGAVSAGGSHGVIVPSQALNHSRASRAPAGPGASITETSTRRAAIRGGKL